MVKKKAHHDGLGKSKAIQRYLSRFSSRNRRYVFGVVFALLGTLLLIVVQAAPPTFDVQPENAQRQGTTSVLDTSASGGAFLQFSSSNQPPQLSGTWRRVFEDDFTNPSVSLSSVWELHPPFTTKYPGAVSVANGVMTLKTGELTNNEWTHVSTAGPRRSTEPNYPAMKAWREGYFEARFRYTDSEWSWPAFWLFSANKVEVWPGEKCPAQGGYYNAEWDMVENGVQNGWQHRPSNSWYARVIHKNTTDHTDDGYCGQPDEDKQYAQDFTGQKNLSDWHTWGGRWVGNQLCTYLDNQQLNCETAYDTMNQPMVINIDINFLGNCPSWCGTRPKELQLQVDWVRVWQKT